VYLEHCSDGLYLDIVGKECIQDSVGEHREHYDTVI